MRPFLHGHTALALAAALCAGALPLGAAAATDNEALLAQLQALAERVERLEAQNTQLRSALESDRISENEPELATRLKAVEVQQQALQSPTSKLVEALDGISVEGSLTGMVQQARRSDLDIPGTGRSRTNYRGDVAVTLPGGTFGDNKGKIFMHARFGQGEGLALRPTYTGTANSTTFSGSDPDDTQFTVAQAWYQLDMPLGGAHSARKASFTVGKIDPFMFFDQNSIADDETRHFVNNVFVHNPLLDSGGDIGADRYGFSPGVIAAYEDASDKAMPWGVHRWACLVPATAPTSAPAVASRLSLPRPGWRRTSIDCPAPTAPTPGATPAPPTLTTAKRATAAWVCPWTSASPTP